MVARSHGEPPPVFSSARRKESPAWLSCCILKACRRTPKKPVKGHKSIHFCSPTKPVRTLICKRVSLRSSTLMSNSWIKERDNDDQHKHLMLNVSCSSRQTLVTESSLSCREETCSLYRSTSISRCSCLFLIVTETSALSQHR